MPYDPDPPLENTEIDAAQMRSQLQGLKELIDLIATGTISVVFIDSITVVGPFDPPAASVSLVGTELYFTFAIPRGIDGANGAPGEVTNAALAAEIAGVVAGSSANSNGVGTLDTPFADPDDEALRGKLNELLAALRRV
jgi:hypothetical protein